MPPGVGSKWDAGINLLQKSQRAPPHSQVWSFPHIGCALQHPGLGATIVPSTKLSSAGTHLTPLGTDEDLLHSRHRPSPKAKDEASTDPFWSQTCFLHRCCGSAFGWSFLRTFSAAKVSPTFLVPHLLCATHPAYPSSPCERLSLLFCEHQ